MYIYMIRKIGTEDFYCDRPQQWWRQEFASIWRSLEKVRGVFAKLEDVEIVKFEFKEIS